MVSGQDIHAAVDAVPAELATESYPLAKAGRRSRRAPPHTWATEALIADKPARLEANSPAISQKQRTAIPWRFARAAPAS
ncbi:hypothetical protein [Methylobacterium fujisawaense]|uniref:hypothetical protein n=1 Tax=Methylobacterium fujisawaense TaxID=107400 RepID=UPI0036FB36FF